MSRSPSSSPLSDCGGGQAPTRLRGQSVPLPQKPSSGGGGRVQEYRVVGHNVQRADAIEKVTGVAQYIADVRLPHTLEARVLRSPHPHARILNVDTSAAKRLPGVLAVVTGE